MRTLWAKGAILARQYIGGDTFRGIQGLSTQQDGSSWLFGDKNLGIYQFPRLLKLCAPRLAPPLPVSSHNHTSSLPTFEAATNCQPYLLQNHLIILKSLRCTIIIFLLQTGQAAVRVSSQWINAPACQSKRGFASESYDSLKRVDSPCTYSENSHQKGVPSLSTLISYSPSFGII